MATNYEIDYNDKRLTDVKSAEQTALNEVDKTYGDMIGKADEYYQKQIDAADNWEKEQTKLQNEQTDFAIQKIEQQREQAQKDYTKEQAGAYADWKKQSDPYGANAEKMASMGMTGSGYSESAQVSMYNTYQNRVATARETIAKANLEFDNGIKEAQLQNSSILAEIHYNAYQKKLELSLAGFQYNNQLVLEKASKKLEIENNYYARYQDVLAQINQENAMAEEIRQYNESLALQKAQLEEEQRQFNETMAYNKSKSSGSGGGGGGGVVAGGGGIIEGDLDETEETDDRLIDWDSVEKLGLNITSAEQLDSLIRSGYVTEYEKDGVLRFALSPKTKKLKNLYQNLHTDLG